MADADGGWLLFDPESCTIARLGSETNVNAPANSARAAVDMRIDLRM
jgi:hypothetical protein